MALAWQAKVAYLPQHRGATDHTLTNASGLVADLPSQQAEALVKLKQQIDPQNKLNWALPASNACSFEGVTCDGSQEVLTM